MNRNHRLLFRYHATDWTGQSHRTALRVARHGPLSPASAELGVVVGRELGHLAGLLRGGLAARGEHKEGGRAEEEEADGGAGGGAGGEPGVVLP